MVFPILTTIIPLFQQSTIPILMQIALKDNGFLPKFRKLQYLIPFHLFHSVNIYSILLISISILLNYYIRLGDMLQGNTRPETISPAEKIPPLHECGPIVTEPQANF